MAASLSGATCDMSHVKARVQPHKFGQDKDRSEAKPYKADQNDGVGLYYVMVNLFRDISQSHKRNLELLSMQPPPNSGQGH